jgi:hypothetical protein
MTYAQMFQSVSAQYDLDWRMLAAQAYVESGFDALALSSAGAMGLMQVLLARMGAGGCASDFRQLQQCRWRRICLSNGARRPERVDARGVQLGHRLGIFWTTGEWQIAPARGNTPNTH